MRPELLNGYQSLFDASIFHAVWRNIDPEPQFYPQPLTDLDETTLPIVRAKNFDNVIRNMRALYEEELGQTILVVPDCMTLGHAPGWFSKQSLLWLNHFYKIILIFFFFRNKRIQSGAGTNEIIIHVATWRCGSMP